MAKNRQQIKLSDHFSYGKLLRFTVPSMIMMVFTSIYGIVDGFFVSNYAGKTPFAAVNFIMPYLIIIGTPGFMLGSGGNALVSKIMGEDDKNLANSIFSLLIYTAIVLGSVIAGISVILMPQIASAMGAEGELLDNCVIYGRILASVTPLYILQMMFQSFFVAAEKPKLGLWVSVASGVTNMVLDYVLVGVLPFGLIGAAVASAISQLMGAAIPLFYFARRNTSLLRLGKAKFDGKALLQTTTNGASELMSNISMPLVSILYNVQLLDYAGENGVAAYGTMMYVNMLFLALFFGFTMGSAPVVSFHFGAKNHRELRNLKQKGLSIVGIFSVVMLASSFLLAKPLVRLFVGFDKELYDLTLHGFYIFIISFPLAGYAILLSGFFTALNDGLTSAVISFLRTLVFQIAAVLLLPLIWGIDGIWLSLVVAEIMAASLGFMFLFLKQKKYHY